MQIEITRTIKQKETVDIELPYYYKHDLMPDEGSAVIYGKVEAGKQTKITIRETFWGGARKEYELEIERSDISCYACYITQEHASCEEDYLDAKTAMLEALQGA